MANEVTFGRRNGLRQQVAVERRLPPAKPEAECIASDAHAETFATPELRMRMMSQADPELQKWKQARRQAYRLPWRQLWFLASLFFGIASFVLPDSVNENVDWMLYGLMGLSFYAGVRTRREKKAVAAKPVGQTHALPQ